MKNFVNLNDLHIGAQRSGGTTPQSALALRKWVLSEHASFISKKVPKGFSLFYNGDVLDKFMVPLADIMELHRDWADFLEGDTGREIHVARGNHDLSTDTAKASAFDFLCFSMNAAYPDQFFYYTEPTKINDKLWVIPHVENQALFDKALSDVLAVVEAGSVVMLHANYDNNFALESDHSLNVSLEQAVAFKQKGVTLVFGHEHPYREVSNAIIPGNQFPTSIADLIQSPVKYYTTLTATVTGYTVNLVELYDVRFLLHVVDWRSLHMVDPTLYRFVKVTGSVSAEEAPAALAAISNFRQASDAFVVTNAVQSAQTEELDAFLPTSEEIKSINVLDFLYEQLNEKEAAVVKQILTKKDQQ